MGSDFTYMVIDRPLSVNGGGGVTVKREPGALVPEAAGWDYRARKTLLDTGRIARVVILTKAEAKKLRAAV